MRSRSRIAILGWVRYERDVADTQIRDGLIQRFKFTYEQGLLLGDWPKWKVYREMRGKSDHAHDQKIALEVVAGIPEFLREAIHLREQLSRRLT